MILLYKVEDFFGGIELWGYEGFVSCCSFSIDGGSLVIGGWDWSFFCWDVWIFKVFILIYFFFVCYCDWVIGCVWIKDNLLIFCFSDGFVGFWDLELG